MQITVKKLLPSESKDGLPIYKEATVNFESSDSVSTVISRATAYMKFTSKEWVLTSSDGAPLPTSGDMKNAREGTYYLAEAGLSLESLQKHKTSNDCWVALDSSVVFETPESGYLVYDITTYLDNHPGGKEIVLKNSGACFNSVF